MIEKISNEKTPANIAGDVQKVEEITGCLAIFVTDAMSAYWREQLISKITAFIQIGYQCYIPQLAIDLREHFRKRSIRSQEVAFSPITQLVLFYILLQATPESQEGCTPSFLAQKLGYSPMSIGRAYQDLSAHTLCEIERRGREKHIHLSSSKSDIINRASPHLISPVRKTLYLDVFRELIPRLHIAGESAMAKYTMLSRPRIPVWAIASDRWKQGTSNEAWHYARDAEEATNIVEVWHYNPSLLSNNDIVDPLSLYAQFISSDDPRLQGEAETLLEEFLW
ncbi:hypothetical protein TH19_09245 [Thalassospira profundimaris]|uniref:Uncharacterized protein n=2 Tax=Thalassospira TaxID=168934 RepID=A0A367W7M0_9PROT|nr:hypothetical protein TH19_09245 [Thalassospira profundimaris]